MLSRRDALSKFWIFGLVFVFSAAGLFGSRKGWFATSNHDAGSVVKPHEQQLRAKAIALVVIPSITAGIVALQWSGPSNAPLLGPLFVAYFLFNFGFVWFALRMRPHTKGTRLGVIAVLLNFAAMFVSDIAIIWMCLSVAAVLAALVAAYLLFKEASAARV